MNRAHPAHAAADAAAPANPPHVPLPGRADLPPEPVPAGPPHAPADAGALVPEPVPAAADAVLPAGLPPVPADAVANLIAPTPAPRPPVPADAAPRMPEPVPADAAAPAGTTPVPVPADAPRPLAPPRVPSWAIRDDGAHTASSAVGAVRSGGPAHAAPVRPAHAAPGGETAQSSGLARHARAGGGTPPPTGTPPPAGAASPGGTDPAAPLGRTVRAAARWSLVNTMVMRLGNFVMGIVLARFALGPADWGVYGIAQTVLLVLLSANELGVGLAIIRWDGDPRRFAPTVLTLSTVSSAALYAALFAVAPAVAGGMGSPGATGVLRVLCLCVLLDGIAQVPAGFLTREFAQGRRMVIDLANFVLSTAVTLLLAFDGFGAMSFAWGAVAGNVAALAGFCLAAPGTLRYGWDPGQARALLRFGLPLAGASLLALGVVNADTLIVGSALGSVQLGFYVLAFNISGWPVRIISEAARRVSFAGFSRLAGSPRALADGFGRALGVVMTATVPLCVLLALLARPVVELIYGGAWTPAARALPWLMGLGLIRIAGELAYDCLVAVGRRRALIAVQALWLAALVPVLMAAARHGGVVGVARGHVAVAALLVVPAFLLALRAGGIRPAGVLRACLRPLAGGAAMAAAVLVLHRPLGDGHAGLAALGLLALAVYAVCVLPGSGLLPRRSAPPARPARHGRPRARTRRR